MESSVRKKRPYTFVNRQPAAKRTKKKLDPNHVELLKYQCCKHVKTECETLMAIDPMHVVACRRNTEMLGKTERALTLLTVIMNARDTSGGGQAVHFYAQGHKLCIMAFAFLYNTTPKTINLYSSINVHNDPSYASRICPATGPLVAWLHLRLPQICDESPIKKEYHLPPGTFTKKELRELYCSEIGDLFQRSVSKPSFYRVLDVMFGYLKFPKESRHGKCEDCEKIMTLGHLEQSEENMVIITAFDKRHKQIWM